MEHRISQSLIYQESQELLICWLFWMCLMFSNQRTVQYQERSGIQKECLVVSKWNKSRSKQQHSSAAAGGNVLPESGCLLFDLFVLLAYTSQDILGPLVFPQYRAKQTGWLSFMNFSYPLRPHHDEPQTETPLNQQQQDSFTTDFRFPGLILSWPFVLFISQVGGVCKLSTESALRRCRTPDGKICSGRGKCDCGICICQAPEAGRFYGPRCECHDWVCATHNEKTCNGECSDVTHNTWFQDP